MNKVLLVLTLLLSGCHFLPSKQQELDVFKNHLFKELVFIKKISFINKYYINTKKEIDRPYSTTQHLMTFKKSLSSGYCFYYKLPRKGYTRSGKLLFLKTKKGECDFTNEVAQLNDISNLRITTNDNKLSLKLNFRDKAIELDIPMVNIKKKQEFKRFTKPISGNYLAGAWINKAYKINPHQKFTDHYRDESAKFCERINKKCQITQEYSCNECKFGWYSVVDYHCPGKSSKVCGVSKCGSRGEPACPRGLRRGIISGNELCYENSPFGYCEKGLQTYCDGNKVLVCL